MISLSLSLSLSLYFFLVCHFQYDNETLKPKVQLLPPPKGSLTILTEAKTEHNLFIAALQVDEIRLESYLKMRK